MDVNSIFALVKITVIIFFTAFMARESIRLSLELLKNAGCSIKNYRGNEVVFGMGISFLPIIITSTALGLFLFRSQGYHYMSYLFIAFTIGFVGLLDDFIGDKKTKGLKNHITSFFRGQLTTGFIKAFIGFFTALIISYGISNSILGFILNIFNIALFTNALNLMDLRPGRCIKVFFIIGFIIVILNLKNWIVLLPLIIMLIAAIFYMPSDLNELCMLGDTGSNILGITLGYFCSLTFETASKTFLFVTLMLINLAAEKFSITKIISNNRILNYLDSLGRSRG